MSTRSLYRPYLHRYIDNVYIITSMLHLWNHQGSYHYNEIVTVSMLKVYYPLHNRYVETMLCLVWDHRDP